MKRVGDRVCAWSPGPRAVGKIISVSDGQIAAISGCSRIRRSDTDTTLFVLAVVPVVNP